MPKVSRGGRWDRPQSGISGWLPRARGHRARGHLVGSALHFVYLQRCMRCVVGIPAGFRSGPMHSASMSTRDRGRRMPWSPYVWLRARLSGLLHPALELSGSTGLESATHIVNVAKCDPGSVPGERPLSGSDDQTPAVGCDAPALGRMLRLHAPVVGARCREP